MKKFSWLLAVILVSMLVLAACGGGDEESENDDEWVENVTILTGGEAGVYYPLGLAMGEIMSENVDDVNATGITTGASVVNINDISDGEAEFALVQNDIAYYAQEGTEMFEEEGAREGFSGVFTMYPETIQIVTLADSGIETVEDLEGMRVAVGDVGSGTEANANQILGVHDLTYDDLNEEYMDFGDASSNLQDGNIDAAFVTSGTPTGSIQELSASADVKLVSISDDMIEALEEEYPYYTRQDISNDDYENFDSEASTVAVQAMFIVRDDMPEDQVYELVASIFDNLDDMENAHDRGSDLTLDSAQDGMSIDLHPGAERYYDEN